LIIACMSTYDSTISALESVADRTGATLVNVAGGAPEEAEALAGWAAAKLVVTADQLPEPQHEQVDVSRAAGRI
jgi:hypothetical protein